MKKSLLLLSFLFSLNFSFAQVGTLRYQSKVFTNYDSVMNIVYGSNVPANYTNPIDLALNIYMPAGDSSISRPVIFFTHGGSFIVGNRTTQDVVWLCKEFAKRGYVTVSQSYRLGYDDFFFNAVNATRAVWRAMQDGRAAVRFMKSQASVYKIDTNKIIYGGSSAGGFIGLHLAYLNTIDETPSIVDTTTYSPANLSGLGGLEGITNNLSNTSTVAGIINLCGALADTNMISPTDALIPIVSLHGTQDFTVPYASDTIFVFGNPILPIDGSWAITKKLRTYPNSKSKIFTFCEAPHVPYYEYKTAYGAAYMDTTINIISSFLYENVLNLGIANSQIAGKDSTACKTSGISNQEIAGLKIYPNPVKDQLFIELEKNDQVKINLYTILGSLVYQNTSFNTEILTINTSELKAGVYLLSIQSEKAKSIRKVIIE